MRDKNYIMMMFVMAFLLTGCTREENAPREKENRVTELVEEKVHLSMLYPCDDVSWVATIEELGENFMQEYPHIVLDMKPSEQGIYTENLKIREAINKFPDIFEIKDPYMFAMADKLGVLPKKVSELVENPITIDGKVYAVPLFTSTYGIVYNQVLFKKYNLEVPKTYSEFLEICEILKKNGIEPLAVGGNKVDNLNYLCNYFFQTEVLARNPNWQLQKNKEEVSFQGAETRGMLLKYKELMSSDFILEDSVNMKDNQIVSELVEGNVAMGYTRPRMFTHIIDAYPQAIESDKNTLGEIIDEKDNQIKCRIGWFFMPDEEGNTIAISESDTEWGISKECSQDEEKLEAAALFFDYFYQTAQYREVLQSMYAIPTTKEAVLYPAVKIQQKLLVDYRYAIKSDVYMGNNETPEGFQTSLYKILYSLGTDAISVDTAAEKLDQKWDELVQH